ncbi:MAG: outer membrane protein transport protein [Candidatus Binatia bacterium]
MKISFPRPVLASKTGFRFAGLALLFLLASLGNALAGGYAVPHQTAMAVGQANAVTAGVKDSSAVYYNPAALTEIEGNQFTGGLNYINTVSSVENGGRRAVNIHDDSFIPTFFANFHIPKTDFTLGFGSYTPFGLATSYRDDTIVRFASIRSELKPFYLNWAAAWRISDLISIGAGASYVRGSATLTRAIFLDALGIGIPDGRARITGTDQTFAYNFGLLIKPQDTIKLGLTYRGRAYLDFEGANVKFADFDGTPTNTKVSEGGSLVLPAMVSAGINWQVTPRWSLEFVYDWTKWDDFKNFKTTFATPLPALGGAAPITGIFINADWKNTSTLRLGTLFHLTESWDLMAGITWDETPIPSKTLSPIIPGADLLTLNGGVSYTWRKLQLAVGYMAVFYETRNVQNNVLEANAPPPFIQPFTPGRDKYETFQNFVSISLRYRF